MIKPSSQDILNNFTEKMNAFEIQISGDNIGLSVSGGGDSIALLYLTKEWACKNDKKIFVATVDHGLRKESLNEAQTVKDICRSLGIECTILNWTDWDKSGNLQDAARSARNRLIGNWANSLGLDAVATGHTADDQAETFLLRLARGSGVDGLSGMASSILKEGMLWFRPLLEFHRSELRDYLNINKITWFDDPSNQNMKFDRVKMRKAQSFLNNIGLTISCLNETAQRMSVARNALELVSKEKIENITEITKMGTVMLDLEEFKLLPVELQNRIYSHILKWISGSIYRPRFISLTESIKKLLNCKTHTISGCHVTSNGRSAEICREVSKIIKSNSFSEKFDGRWILESKSSKEELSIGPLGEAGLRQFPDWRELNMSRISILGSPAIWKDELLIAAPMLGMNAGWKCVLEKDSQNFYSAIVTH